MEPITRQEIFLANAAGESTQELKPVTRLEHFLKNVADHVKSIGNGGGGGASIDVTAQVGQTIVVKEVDANGKPTAWESADYQPRTHWSEPVEVLPETTVAVDPDMGMALLPDLAIAGGDKCTVNYNGTEYVCECIDIGDGVLGMGNLGMMDEENPVDTGEPFIAVKTNDEVGNMIWFVMPLDGSESVTLSIIGQIHHVVPDKYLPKPAKVVKVWINTDRYTKQVHFLDYDIYEVYKMARDPNTVVRLMESDATGMLDSTVYDLCGETKRGEEIIFKNVAYDPNNSSIYIKFSTITIQNVNGVITANIVVNVYTFQGESN